MSRLFMVPHSHLRQVINYFALLQVSDRSSTVAFRVFIPCPKLDSDREWDRDEERKCSVKLFYHGDMQEIEEGVVDILEGCCDAEIL